MSKYRCIFCQSPEKLSREHIWADWLRDYLPRPNAKADHWISHSQNEPKKGKLSRPGDLYAQRLQVVCKACNSGWMSLLQSAAKPTIVRMLGNESWTLNPDEQAALSAWAAMFTMVWEFADPPTATIPQSHRTHLMNTRTVPRDWIMWLGLIDLRDDHSGIANHIGIIAQGVPNGLPIPWRFQSTGFTVGKLLFQTLMLTPAVFSVNPERIAKEHGIAPLHPRRGPVSNLPPLIGRNAFYDLSNRFAAGFGVRTFYRPDPE